jgi:hypothetical protein
MFQSDETVINQREKPIIDIVSAISVEGNAAVFFSRHIKAADPSARQHLDTFPVVNDVG